MVSLLSVEPPSVSHARPAGGCHGYLLTGDAFSAHEAFRIGQVQEVVEPGQQLVRAEEIAQTVAAQAPLGVRATLA